MGVRFRRRGRGAQRCYPASRPGRAAAAVIRRYPASVSLRYAATLALCCIGSNEAFEAIDRSALYAFLLSMKDASNGFRMHDDGEVDTVGFHHPK